jgi:CDP-diacylglycerol--glycerol-3-phosphate 3-phosphatidyltransferase
MGIYALKPAFRRRISRLADALVRSNVSADALTWAALIMSLVGGTALAISSRSQWTLFAVPILALARITLNALDGMVAAAAGTARPFGEFFNELTDRIADAAWFTGLGFVVGFPLALGALAGVLITSYAGTAVKAAGGTRIYGGLMGKADRMILLAIASVVAGFFGTRVLTIFCWTVAAGIVLTLAERIVVAHRELTPR